MLCCRSLQLRHKTEELICIENGSVFKEISVAISLAVQLEFIEMIVFPAHYDLNYVVEIVKGGLGITIYPSPYFRLYIGKAYFNLVYHFYFKGNNFRYNRVHRKAMYYVLHATGDVKEGARCEV